MKQLNDVEKNIQNANTAYLLWTGGYDSTFRLLRLLLDTPVNIQPVYIIDTNRPSTIKEIKTMHVIKEKLKLKYPSEHHRLLNNFYFSVHDIPANPEITDQYRKLCKGGHIGKQYEFLARFAHAFAMYKFELGYECDGYTGHYYMDELLHFHALKKRDPATGDFFEITLSGNAPEGLSMFSYFRFPNRGLTRDAMKEYSIKHGFYDILDSTWFCHRPMWNKPCGVCAPCELIIWYKYYNKLPYYAYIRRLYWPTLRKIVHMVRRKFA